jgi:endonuclease/exonuclease/phosphatase family metal-dependent hydrolase
MGLFRNFTKKSLVIINVLLAVALIVGCNAKYFNPETFWFVGFITIAAPYLFISIFAFIFFWLFAKKKFALISTITILLLWKPLGHIFKFRPNSDFEISKQNNAVRVMSWNVEQFQILEHKKNPALKQDMFNLINEYNPDIACFQEMVASNAYPKAINYMPDMVNALNLKNYYFSYNELDNFDDNHHFGRVIFSKYPIINRKTINFSNRSYENCFQYVDVIKETDTVRVFNVHLQSLRFSNENKAYIDDATNKQKINIDQSKSVLTKLKSAFLKRKIQADAIHAEIEKSIYPVIVCGDFNDVPNSYAYSTIGDNLQNAFTKKGSGVSRTFTGISPTLRIDNIFADKQFDIVQYTRVKDKISDHYPLISDMVLEK